MKKKLTTSKEYIIFIKGLIAGYNIAIADLKNNRNQFISVSKQAVKYQKLQEKKKKLEEINRKKKFKEAVKKAEEK